MKLLLDTHLLLWVAGSPEKLSSKALKLIDNPGNELYFSAASFWEIAIKCKLDRPDFQVNASVLRRGLLDNGYIELPVVSEHTIFLDNLPLLHKDPFDRLLVAQAISEGFTLLTTDGLIVQYPAAVKKV
ncbi:MAG: type II toxin-antitoxin system VapC family toxin [Gammaproteobacteria bacterium]|nr:type II toxin-antitoxin system VapC family toxin [Gammaproteobacteria bacterium]